MRWWFFLHHSLLSKLCLPKSQFYWFYINNCKFLLSSYTGSLWYFAYAFQIPVSIKIVKIRTYTSSHLSVLPPIEANSEKDETIEEDQILHFKLYGGGYFCPFIFSKCFWNYKNFLITNLNLWLTSSFVLLRLKLSTFSRGVVFLPLASLLLRIKLYKADLQNIIFQGPRIKFWLPLS